MAERNTRDAPIRLLAADDTDVVREGLQRILETAGDIELIGVANTVKETVQEVERTQPDVLLIDLKWGGDTTAGVRAILEIKQRYPDVAVIAITVFEHLIPDARRAGADAALAKTFTREELLRLIRDLATSSKATSFPQEPEPSPILLTMREREVLRLLAQGRTDREVAESLGLNIHTVKNHIASILAKLEVTTRALAVMKAEQMGSLRDNLLNSP